MSTAGTVTAILASAVIVLGGFAAVVRLIWKVAQSLRDNTRTTNATATRLSALDAKMDKGFGEIAERLRRLEGRRRL